MNKAGTLQGNEKCSPIHYVHNMQIRQGSAVTFWQPDYAFEQSAAAKMQLVYRWKSKKTYSGRSTIKTVKRIRKAIDILLQISPVCKAENPVTKKIFKHTLSVITLTVAERKHNLTGKQAYPKLLKPFIRIMREKHDMNTYIWKAELQESGQLHYHITTRSIIHFQIIKDVWNNLQRKNNLLKDFKAKFGHDNPNGTDIHEVKVATDFSFYLSKEIAKSIQNKESINGKIWDCSTNLKKCKFFTTELNIPHSKIILRQYHQNNIYFKEMERCSIIRCKHIKSKSLLSIGEQKKYSEYLDGIRRVQTFDVVRAVKNVAPTKQEFQCL